MSGRRWHRNEVVFTVSDACAGGIKRWRMKSNAMYFEMKSMRQLRQDSKYLWPKKCHIHDNNCYQVDEKRRPFLFTSPPYVSSQYPPTSLSLNPAASSAALPRP